MAVAVLDMLDGVKLLLEKYLKSSFTSIADEVLLPVDGDVDGLINELSSKQAGYEFAMMILGETSMNGHGRVKDGIDKAGGLEGLELPSGYKIKQKRPKIVDVSFQTTSSTMGEDNENNENNEENPL